MTREEIINEIKCILSELNNGEDAVSYLTQNDVKWINETIKALEQEPILDKIFCIIHPLSIMSTPELEHKAIMQIAEMLEPLCLPERE